MVSDINSSSDRPTPVKILGNTATATQLSNSKGKATTRLQFTHITKDENDTVGKSVQVAIKIFSSKTAENQQALLGETPSLSFWQRLFWIPTTVTNEHGQTIAILVNKQSAKKRLGLSSEDLETACKTNTLGSKLTKEDVKRTETLLDYTDSNIKAAHRILEGLQEFSKRKAPSVARDQLVHVSPKGVSSFPGIILYKNGEFYLVKTEADVIGSGSFKEVVTAKTLDAGDLYAVLRDRDEYCYSKNLRELEVLKQFNGQEGFPVTYGNIEIDGTLFVFQKLYQGNLKDAGHLNLQQKTQIAKSILSALKVLHDKDMMHGDIKPANILYYINDKGVVEVVLADFGFTRKLSSEQAPKLGTYLYAAPEGFTINWIDPGVLKESAKRGAKMDVWSMGLTLYFLFKDTIEDQYFKNRIDTLFSFQKALLSGAGQKHKKEIKKGDIQDEQEAQKIELRGMWEHAQEEVAKNQGKSQGQWIVEPNEKKEPVAHLIWSMLQIDPNKRITTEEALKRIEALLGAEKAAFSANQQEEQQVN